MVPIMPLTCGVGDAPGDGPSTGGDGDSNRDRNLRERQLRAGRESTTDVDELRPGWHRI
jgi:hypothetical protein